MDGVEGVCIVSQVLGKKRSNSEIHLAGVPYEGYAKRDLLHEGRMLYMVEHSGGGGGGGVKEGPICCRVFDSHALRLYALHVIC